MPARDVCRVRVQEATPAEEPPAEEAAAETPAAGDSGQEAPPADEAAADEDAAPKPDGEQALDVDTEDTGAPAEPGQGEAAAEGGDAAAEGGDAAAEGGDAAAEGGEAATEGGDAAAEGGVAATDEGEAIVDGGETAATGGEADGEGGEAVVESTEAAAEGGDVPAAEGAEGEVEPSAPGAEAADAGEAKAADKDPLADGETQGDSGNLAEAIDAPQAEKDADAEAAGDAAMNGDPAAVTDQEGAPAPAGEVLVEADVDQVLAPLGENVAARRSDAVELEVTAAPEEGLDGVIEGSSAEHDLLGQANEALASNAASLELSRTRAVMAGATSENMENLAMRVQDLERELELCQSERDAAKEQVWEKQEELSRLQTSKASLELEVQALRGRLEKEEDQMWDGVEATSPPGLPLRGVEAESQMNKDQGWGVHDAGGGRGISPGKEGVSEQRLREELTRKNEQILELRIQVATFESEMRSTRDLLQMRSNMEMAQVRQEAEWQRQMGMAEMARNRHQAEIANAKNQRLQTALEGAVTEMRERRRDVEVLKSKLAELSSKFESSARHLIDESGLLSHLKSVKQGMDNLNREAELQIKAMDQQHQNFLEAARWAGEDEVDDLSTALPKGPAPPRASDAAGRGGGKSAAGKGDKGNPSPAKRSAEAKGPSPGKKGNNAVPAAAAADVEQGQGSPGQQPPQQQQMQQMNIPRGMHGYGNMSAGLYAGEGGYAGVLPMFQPPNGPPGHMGGGGLGAGMGMDGYGAQHFAGGAALGAGGGGPPGRFFAEANHAQHMMPPHMPPQDHHQHQQQHQHMSMMHGVHGGGYGASAVRHSGGMMGGGPYAMGVGGMVEQYGGGALAMGGGWGQQSPPQKPVEPSKPNPVDAELLQYMDDDWWREPKPDGNSCVNAYVLHSVHFDITKPCLCLFGWIALDFFCLAPLLSKTCRACLQRTRRENCNCRRV